MNASVETGYLNGTTDQAVRTELLTPRFYRTDVDAVSALDIDSVRDAWEAMMREYREDRNRGHYRQEFDYDAHALAGNPELRAEFIDFLTSSLTAEYSGCVLYSDLKKNTDNPDIAELMGFMARDESRHAGCINKALKQLGVAVDLGFLKREKRYTFFNPKFIYYATYLSEKIGYARHITLFRHLEKHPEQHFHPIFDGFLEWSTEQFRHGEAFALMLRTQPELLKGSNKLWIRFFLLAVFATMYVRDHNRPRLFAALKLDPAEFDHRVFDITTEITRQVFPLTLRTSDPRFRQGLERLCDLNQQMISARERGGFWSRLQKMGLAVKAGLTFGRLYLLPATSNELPTEGRLTPAW